MIQLKPAQKWVVKLYLPVSEYYDQDFRNFNYKSCYYNYAWC